LGEGWEEALEAEVYRRVRGTRWEGEVRAVVGARVAAARAAGGLDLYVPVRSPRYAAPVAASFLVSQVVLPNGPAPEVVLGRLAAQGSGAVRELAGTLAVRREYEEPPREGVPVASRHVEYALAVPRDAARFVTVSFCAAGRMAEAFVELFEAMMTTFRWRTEQPTVRAKSARAKAEERDGEGRRSRR
jgi:hypothetical protein